MKKRIGKIALCTMVILFLAACVATWVLPEKVEAANYESFTLTIPDSGQTDVTVVLYDPKTGYLIDKDDGTSTVTTAWGDAEIEAEQHAPSGVWYLTVPSVNQKVLTVLIFNDTAANTEVGDEPDEGPVLLNTSSQWTFTDTVPTRNGSIY